MTDPNDRELRDPRTSTDPRDPRDPRESDDPRDERDPRQPGDPRLGGESGGVPRFVKAIVVGIAVGLAAVTLGAWQLATIRSNEEQRDCKRAVASRIDNRAMWIWLGEQFPESAIEIGLVEQLDEKLPLLRCSGGNPNPTEES